MSKRILILSLFNWFGSARLPRALRAAGFRVAAAAEPGSLIAHSRFVDRLYPLSLAQTRIGYLAPLVAAIEEEAPDLVLPGDEGSAFLLTALALGRAPLPPSVTATLRASLGRLETWPLRFSRRAARAIVRGAGLPAPEQDSVRGFADAEAFARDRGWPVVLKREGTAGGQGVRICASTAELRRAFDELSIPPREPVALAARVKAMAHHAYWAARSGFRLAGDLCVPPVADAPLCIERFTPGRPAYCSAVARNGELLANLSVKVEETYPGPTGPSTRVMGLACPTMEGAARRLVAELGFTGFCGLDFLVSDADGLPYFLEFNPRSTPVVHLSPLLGVDLCGALRRAMDGIAATSQPAPLPLSVALFPQDWLRQPRAEGRRADILDIPADDPGLLAALNALLPADCAVKGSPVE